MIIVMKTGWQHHATVPHPQNYNLWGSNTRKSPISSEILPKNAKKLCFTAFFCRKSLQNQKLFVPLHSQSRDRAVVARQAHNLKVGGSTPSPATNNGSSEQILSFHFFCSLGWRQTTARRPSQAIGGTRPAPCTSAGNSPNAQPNCATYANSFFMHNL